MGRLIYSATASLDGYVADKDGTFEWAAPGDDVHAFVNELERPIGTYLYGRRMYDVMAAWQTMPTGDDQPQGVRDFAEIWRAADKIVYSTTLAEVRTLRTRLERNLVPSDIRALKESSDRDLSVGGPGLAIGAMQAGLVDELQLFLNPIVVGGGTLALPRDIRIGLELADQRRFDDGVVYLRYLVLPQDPSLR